VRDAVNANSRGWWRKGYGSPQKIEKAIASVIANKAKFAPFLKP
jgi:hypothetical protein